ncbi:MAG TPA: hypothetical protein VFE85_02485 [Woeseiaceae bacterium]|nr:hypothetical protein [Woeseiaceae bacterium]
MSKSSAFQDTVETAQSLTAVRDFLAPCLHAHCQPGTHHELPAMPIGVPVDDVQFLHLGLKHRIITNGVHCQPLDDIKHVRWFAIVDDCELLYGKLALTRCEDEGG